MVSSCLRADLITSLHPLSHSFQKHGYLKGAIYSELTKEFTTCWMTEYLGRCQQVSTHATWGTNGRPKERYFQSPTWWSNEVWLCFCLFFRLLTRPEMTQSQLHHQSPSEHGWWLTQAGNTELAEDLQVAEMTAESGLVAESLPRSSGS